MTTLFAERALLPSGWANNVRIAIADGRIAGIEPDASAHPGDERCAMLVPGMPNLHSHAFQRGMAGLAETRGPGTDNFWSWREVMYRFALGLDPDQMQAIAAKLYVEMLEAGFTRVGEFHYLHHDRDGRPYADPAEMVHRIAAAAGETGIGLTLLPSFYAHGNFGSAPAHAGQRRFLNDVEGFARLLESSRKAVESLPEAVIGIAPHSLRAVAPDELALLLALAPSGPVHIHAAEQVKEVEDSLAWSGARPVEWLLANAPVDRRWCLIHATHMTDAETRALAATGAVAGLCPITEANLGDGIFPGPLFWAAGGAFGIGSDSNVLIGVADELRQLEYAQRLGNRLRNVLAPPGGSNGHALFIEALRGGAQALGAGPASIEPGAPADLVALDSTLPELAGRPADAVLDSWIFAGVRAVDRVWVRGGKLVEGGRHRAHETVAEGFRAVMTALATA